MAQEVSSSLLLTWLGSAAVQYSLTEREHRAHPRITVPESFAAAVKSAVAGRWSFGNTPTYALYAR